MFRMGFVTSLLLLFTWSFHAQAKTSTDQAYPVAEENYRQINDWFNNDLKELNIKYDKAITADDLIFKPNSTSIRVGHRTQYFPPYHPPRWNNHPPQYVITCFYQNDFGWMFTGFSPNILEADYLARIRCLQSSSFCYPRGCR